MKLTPLRIAALITAVLVTPIIFAALIWVVVYVIRTLGCGGVYCHFDQDGIATIWGSLIGLFGGMAALGGAVLVGLRQTEIMTIQARIQDRQTMIASEAVTLEGMKLRADLYERRLAVYNAARLYLSLMIEERQVAGYQDDDDGEVGQRLKLIYTDFVEAVGAAHFLMSAEVSETLNSYSWIGNRFMQTKAQMSAQADTPSYQKACERHRLACEEALEARSGLRDLFADYLKIQEPTRTAI